jgi:hypothetical protein
MREIVIRSKDDVADFVEIQPMTPSGLGVVLIALVLIAGLLSLWMVK